MTKLLQPLVMFGCLTMWSFADAGEINTQLLTFKVFLDDNEIGFHNHDISPIEGGETVSIEASFDIEIFFINVFSYRHQTDEVWQQGCLVSLNSTTTENSDKEFVKSSIVDDALQVESVEHSTRLTSCVSSFAYWDVERLQAEYLLNSQTGEYVPAQLTALGETSFEFNDSVSAATQYRLFAEDAFVDLWYDDNNVWMALQTKVNGGRVLTYYRDDSVAVTKR
ncbi:MAG: hypothetical protein ACI9NY_001697 [Kiritimatiellia bacterium]|jgi:hypothetical protein